MATLENVYKDRFFPFRAAQKQLIFYTVIENIIPAVPSPMNSLCSICRPAFEPSFRVRVFANLDATLLDHLLL